MKLLVVSILVILCATHVVCLTIEEQNKLLAELNKDRQELGKKIGIKLEVVKYNAKLEDDIRKISPPCSYSFQLGGLTLLRTTDVTFALLSDGRSPGIPFFYRYATQIGCVKDFACSKIATWPEKFNGTHVQYNGACKLEPSFMVWDGVELNKTVTTGWPRPDKYGKLIGVSDPYQITNDVSTASAPETFTGNEEANNSSGNVLSIFLSLIIVFYF